MNRLPILLALLIPLLAGCSVKPKPPVFNLYPRSGIAILPVVNTTKDPGLGTEIRERLIESLKALGPVPLSDPDAVLAAAAGPSPATTPWTDAALRRRVAAGTGCDLILTVSVGLFREVYDSESPKRVRSDFSYATFRWGWADTATAQVDAEARIVQVSTGKIVWKHKSSAKISRSRWTDLAWPGDNADAPKTGWDSLKHNARPAADPDPSGLKWKAEPLAQGARDAAIQEVVHGLLPDFRGRDGWLPPSSSATPALH